MKISKMQIISINLLKDRNKIKKGFNRNLIKLNIFYSLWIDSLAFWATEEEG